jgi:hypothetical protein
VLLLRVIDLLHDAGGQQPDHGQRFAILLGAPMLIFIGLAPQIDSLCS